MGFDNAVAASAEPFMGLYLKDKLSIDEAAAAIAAVLNDGDGE
ncbi:MAG: hypothetical protein OSB58_19860 [Alphaproteobacteria bacterium]|jgi:hypothetical protein|nr:hypothetical protein [Alphaproteobacteria bacterium]